MARSRCCVGTSLTRSPSIKTSPEVTDSSPASIRNVVVLPQPDGPSSTTNSPSRISSDRSSTTHVPPKCLLTLRNSILTGVVAPYKNYPLTAPSERPRTRYFCSARAKTRMGTSATAAAALITPHLISYCVTRPAIPTGNVIAASVCVSTSANRNSFHEMIKQNTAVAASPGVTSGNTTRTSAPKRESPSTSAASSRSRGKSAKNPRIIQTTNGKLNAV